MRGAVEWYFWRASIRHNFHFRACGRDLQFLTRNRLYRDLHGTSLSKNTLFLAADILLNMMQWELLILLKAIWACSCTVQGVTHITDERSSCRTQRSAALLFSCAVKSSLRRTINLHVARTRHPRVVFKNLPHGFGFKTWNCVLFFYMKFVILIVPETRNIFLDIRDDI